MAGDGIDVDPEGIGAAGGRVAAAATGMGNLLAQVQSHLAAEPNPFGGDELGALIQECYQAISELAFESLSENVADVGDQGGTVTVMAHEYEDLRIENAAQVRDLHERYG